ncbi:hypothetical protein N9L29_03415 [Litoricolaceae bacterium]|nr:hypothetical protein [Litorivicinaceae bacterium]
MKLLDSKFEISKLACACLRWCLLQTFLWLPVSLHADTVVFEIKGKSASLELPAGYCEMPNNEIRSRYMRLLEEKTAVIKPRLNIQVVFAPCSGYKPRQDPWGYIAAIDIDATGTTQAKLNKSMESNLKGAIAESLDFVTSIKYSEEHEKLTGSKIESHKVGAPTVWVANRKQYLWSAIQRIDQIDVQSQTRVNTKEMAFTSIMVRNGRVINICGYAPLSNREGISELLRGLQSSADTLKIR